SRVHYERRARQAGSHLPTTASPARSYFVMYYAFCLLTMLISRGTPALSEHPRSRLPVGAHPWRADSDLLPLAPASYVSGRSGTGGGRLPRDRGSKKMGISPGNGLSPPGRPARRSSSGSM